MTVAMVAVRGGGAWWRRWWRRCVVAVRGVLCLLYVVQLAGPIGVDSSEELEDFVRVGVLFQAHRHEQLTGGEGTSAGGRATPTGVRAVVGL